MKGSLAQQKGILENAMVAQYYYQNQPRRLNILVCFVADKQRLL